jgi:molybdate transport system substrate-binding protein
MHRLLQLLTAAAVLLAAPGATAREGGSVSVAAAANLKPALEPIARAFEAANPGAAVAATYGASGRFVAQLRSGAPFDLFLSADAEGPAAVAAAGLADGPPFTYAYGALVVWVPAASALDLEGRGLAALADPSVRRIAIANPELAPYGRAAVQALRSAGLYERLRGRLVTGQNAAQAAQFAQSGNAQAALLPRSLALAPPLASEGRHAVVPPESHEPIRQDGVVVKGARQAALARALAEFIAAGPGREILERSGYAVPPR